MKKQELLDFIESIENYAGGQLSILRGEVSKGTHEHYCGTIEKIVIENDSLKVKLAWNAKIVPLKTRSDKSRWVKYDELEYVFDLNNYNLWENFDYDNSRIFPLNESFSLKSNVAKERVYLKTSKVKTRLDPLSIKGLL